MTPSVREPAKTPSTAASQADPVRQGPETSQGASPECAEDQRSLEDEKRIEDMLDEAGRDSFPASDPPSWISRGPED